MAEPEVYRSLSEDTRMYVKCASPGKYHCMFITDDKRVIPCNAINTQYMCSDCKIVEGVEQLFNARIRRLRKEKTRAKKT